MYLASYLSVFQRSTRYCFSGAKFDRLLPHQKLNKLLCFTTLSTSFSHGTSDRTRCRLPSGERDTIRSGHLLSSICTTCPYHLNRSFSSLPTIAWDAPIFSLITSLLTFGSLEVLAALLQNTISVQKIFFFWTCNSRLKFPNCNRRVLSITVQIILFFIFTEIYLLLSRLLRTLVAPLACQVTFKIFRCIFRSS